MKKEVEMFCLSDLEGFDREEFEACKEHLARRMKKFGWEFSECVIEENNKVWSCKPAAIWFLTPDFVCHTED